MLALALKYRPSNFDGLIGQDQVVKSLKNALDIQRLGHAYLFSGLRGSGKTSTARIFAKAMVCSKGPTSMPCEVCDNCKMANENRHIDIIEMDAASHRKIDDIRDLIEQTRYKPAIARFKIFIIDEVHMLTKEAFNALLKTLEEPPEYVKFILATTDPLKLPLTIISRTQHFRFRPINKNEIVKHLQFILSSENIKYEDGVLQILARSGSGSLRDTLTLLDQAIIFTNSNLTKASVSSMLGLLDPDKIEKIFETILKNDKNELINLAKELEGYETQNIIDEMIVNLKDKFLNKDSRYSLLLCERFFKILSKSKTMLSVDVDDNFVLLLMFFMMMEATNLKSIDEMIGSLEKDKLNTLDTSMQVSFDKPKQAKKAHYDEFLKNLYDRSYELGKCFDVCIEFVKFENNIMFLNSSASGENQDILRKSSSVIMKVLRQTFDKETKIKIDSYTKEENIQKNDKNIENVNLKNETNKEIQTQNSLNEVKISDIKIDDNQSLNLNKNKEDENISYMNRLFGDPQIQNT
ncbi:DNA polymerase III subunit gamma/tau [Campylobacter sputorum]|uniref:DNA polymerase III subunit gamma/tau n=1 Tax=Campylobacter sputorum TaxID=206 RepID=UPI00053BFEE5|nr:DNA polymerase III subunit gamma/tau [Campylobacter sputorum]